MTQVSQPVARLDWNESPIGPPAGAVARLVTGAERLHLYPRGLHEEVTAAIARRQHVPAAAVLLTGGIDDATDLVLSISDSVWCAVPGFHGYRHRAAVFGRVVKDIPLDEDWQPMTPPAAFRSGGAVLLAQPNNPTGNLFDRRWLAQVLGEAELLMIDETYRHFCDDAWSWSRSVLRHDNLLVFISFSKEYGLAGVRLGALIGPPTLIGVLRERQRFHAVDSIALYAAQGALEDTAHLATLRRYTTMRGHVIWQRCPPAH